MNRTPPKVIFDETAWMVTANAALQAGWDLLREQLGRPGHRLPEAEVTVGTSVPPNCGTMWANRDRPRIVLGYHPARRGARDAYDDLATPTDAAAALLHAAAHAISQDIPPNPAVPLEDGRYSDGRYHGRKFADEARALGLTVDSTPGQGFSRTSLPPSVARAQYADLLKVLRPVRRDAALFKTTEARPSRRAAYVCNCGPAEGSPHGRRLWMVPSVFAKGPLTCAVCRSEFRQAP